MKSRVVRLCTSLATLFWLTNCAPTVTNIGGTGGAAGAGGTTSTDSYCVEGGVLHEIPGPSDGGLTAMGDIVLTKQ